MFIDDKDVQKLLTHLRITRIIIGVMIMGIMIFTAIAVFVVQGRRPNPNQQLFLSALACAFFAVMFVMWWVIPELVARNLVRQIAAGANSTDLSKLLAVNHSRIIIAAALLDGAAMLGCIAYMVEEQAFALAVPGLVCALLAATFPTRERLEGWVEAQQRRISDWRAEHSA